MYVKNQLLIDMNNYVKHVKLKCNSLWNYNLNMQKKKCIMMLLRALYL